LGLVDRVGFERCLLSWSTDSSRTVGYGNNKPRLSPWLRGHDLAVACRGCWKLRGGWRQKRQRSSSERQAKREAKQDGR
jgi:hypothetical protein